MIPQISELYAPALGSALLKSIGPFGAQLFNLSFILCSTLVLPFIPETLKRDPSGEISLSLNQEEPEQQGFGRKLILQARERYLHIIDYVCNDIFPITRQRLIIYTLIAALINQLLRTVAIFLMQYMVARFHWRVESVSVPVYLEQSSIFTNVMLSL
jgi:hypothetical protein